MNEPPKVEEKPENPPVFPQSKPLYKVKNACVELVPGTEQCVSGGLSLRDYFAAAAMECYLRIRRHAGVDDRTVSQWIARDAYKQADAMLAERGKS